MGNSEKWIELNISDQSGKIICITGSNRGLGLEDAKILAGKGAQVIMACRDVDKANSAREGIRNEYPDAMLDVMELNLADFASIDEFSAHVLENYVKLDVLINNAGGVMGAYQKTAQGFEFSFGVNHLGHFRLTALLLPLLLQTPNARIVNVSSSAHRWGKINFVDLNTEKDYKPMKAYSQSKLANLLFTYELQRRLDAAGKEICVVASHPGWARTHISKARLTRLISKIFAQSPTMGALPTVYAAVGDAVTSGKYFGPGGLLGISGFPKEVQSSKMARGIGLAGKLWQISEERAGVNYKTILES